jgi:hypothetical protein
MEGRPFLSQEERTGKELSLRPSEDLILDSNLQYYEKIKFCCLRCPVCGALLQ